ncbi:hypothetical protein LIER_41088 [Lithospermum erythrorhizon]|uniref:Protein kinase domain-containing protein n=1 Tax=Lithospermum erythrorhizon TaxID=34254 RepID=A0AAV3R724_LITER
MIVWFRVSGAAISNSREWGVNGSSSKGGDPVYEAPELKSNLNFSENVDSYSFGLVLLEMLSAPITTVFEKTELFQKARSGILPDVEDEKLGPVLRALLEEDPNCRLTPKGILSCLF